jgi:hypothetical protein
MRKTAEIIKSIINLTHSTVHKQMNVAYRKKRIETYMEKLLFKPVAYPGIFFGGGFNKFS